MSRHDPNLVKDYHLMFTTIKKKAVRCVKTAVSKDKLWRAESDEQAFEIIKKMFTSLSGVYDIPVPRLIRHSSEVYMRFNETVGLPHPSLVSALHEYRHHMQKYGMQAKRDIEVDARGWSISMFKTALPKSFDKAWRAGRVWYMPPHPQGSQTEIIVKPIGDEDE